MVCGRIQPRSPVVSPEKLAHHKRPGGALKVVKLHEGISYQSQRLPVVLTPPEVKALTKRYLCSSTCKALVSEPSACNFGKLSVTVKCGPCVILVQTLWFVAPVLQLFIAQLTSLQTA